METDLPTCDLPNRTFLVRFGGISGSFGLAMGILARLRLAKLRAMARPNLPEGDMGICGVAVFTIFHCGDAVNKISTCGVAVISNPTVCEGCVFHAAVFGELKLLAVQECFDLPLSNLH